MGDDLERSPAAPASAARAPSWARWLVTAMDDALPIPGTRFRIGWDAIAGFVVPGLGDAITAASHVALLVAAFQARVPAVVLMRMLWNALVDVITGLVPLVGDAFDVAFKANVRNLELLERALHAEAHGRNAATRGDYAVVCAALLGLLAIIVTPLIGAVYGLRWVYQHFVH
jgi:hypothetical protein